MSIETIEGTAEEVGAELVPASPPPTTLFRTDDPVEVIDRAAKVADALKGVLDRQHLTQNIGGRSHVRVEGWTTLGSMLGVVPVVVWSRPIDKGWEARVEARTLDGRVVGAAESECTRDERTWKTRDDYALRSMAQTRATSKALRGPLGFIVTLAGYEATPAEEMPSDHGSAPQNGSPTPVGDPTSQPVDENGLKQLRVLYKESGLDAEDLRLRLVSVGAQDVQDVRKAMKQLTVHQAGVLFNLLSEEAHRRG